MLSAVLLGALQGVTEWLPVSSEGIVVSVYSFTQDKPVDEAVAYALWLHMGTMVSALVVFRTDIHRLILDLLSAPKHPSSLTCYLVLTTMVSGLIGLPLLVSLKEVTSAIGASAMCTIGVFMIITGVLLLRAGRQGIRSRESVVAADAILVGLAQGLAVLPGLSRSGLTVSTLLARGIDRREALVLSFLMSIPASAGAGLYSAVDSGLAQTVDGIIASAVAAIVGILVIRGVLSMAERLNFGWFVISIGILILVGALWQGLG